MKIELVSPTHIDQAWRDGADTLSLAIDGLDEVTIDQLKLILSRGERTLVRLAEDNGDLFGWGVFRIDQYPNLRVAYITELVLLRHGFERFFPKFCEMAKQLGCSEVRCACKPAQARLFRAKCKFRPVYEVLKYTLE